MSGRIPDDAFSFYVSQGVARSYQGVADHYGVSKRAVTKHAVKEQWAERLQRIEDQARERADARLVDTVEEMRSRHLKTLRAMHARVISALQKYPLNSGMEAMKAAEMVIKMERLIAGEASERTALTIEEVTRRELGSWLTIPGRPEDAEPDERDPGQ